MRKVEKTDTAVVSSTAPGTLEDIKDSGAPAAVPDSKPFGRAQVPMAAKPVATVPPMAASKAMGSTASQPTVPTKPKVSMYCKE